MVPVFAREVCFVVDGDGGITACAYNKLCFNLLICWAIPASQVELCGIHKQFLLLPFIMNWKVALCWWFYSRFLQMCSGVSAYAVCPTIHGCIVSIFRWVYLSLIGVFGSVTFTSVYVSVMAMVVQVCLECVVSVNEELELHLGRLLGSI